MSLEYELESFIRDIKEVLEKAKKVQDIVKNLEEQNKKLQAELATKK
jgi:cell division FtsZ-interacting protein ZapD